MSINKNDMREKIVDVMGTRLAWGDGETFAWPNAYEGEAYAHEAEVESTNSSEGQLLVTIPLSISDEDEPDTWVQVAVQLTIAEIIEN